MKAKISQLLAAFIILMKLSKPLIAVGAKAFSILVKLFKGAGIAKVSLGAASFGVYSVLIDWRFAACVLLLIGIHESGHVWAMRRMGMRTRGFYFIPLIGGMAVPEEDFPSAWAEGYVALMGPLWGLIITLTAYLIYLSTDNQVFAVAACWMAFVNLLNLIPIFPLDGGRVIRTLSQTFSGIKSIIVVIGISMFGMLYCALHDYWLFVFFGFLGMIEAFSEHHRKTEERFALQTDWEKNNQKAMLRLADSIGKMLGLAPDVDINQWRAAIKNFSKQSEWQERVCRLRALREKFEKWETRRVAYYEKSVRINSGRKRLTRAQKLRCLIEKETVGGIFQACGVEPLSVDGGITIEDARVLQAELASLYAEAEMVIPEFQEQLGRAFLEVGIESRILFSDLASENDFSELKKREFAPVLMSREKWLQLTKHVFYESQAYFSSNGVDSPAVCLMLFMTEEKVLDSFGREYSRHCLFDKPEITSRETIIVGAGYVWLLIVLFSIMMLAGGHQAAEGAVDFFRSF